MVNFFQKPSGALALIVAAVAGPYAAFETDVGEFARRVLTDVMGNESSESASADSLLSNFANYASGHANGTGPIPLDPGSLDAPSLGYSNFPSPTGPPSATGIPGSHAIPSGYLTSTSHPAGHLPAGHLVSASAPIANTSGMPFQQPSPGAFPGSMQTAAPGIVTPTGPAPYTVPNGTGLQLQPITESYRGPASMVPGGTQQLWDYTLGVPNLEQLGAHPQQLGGGAVHDLREVLRFDIHPGWLPQRFSRVTTVLSNVQFDGLRVPLITGTQPSDLAGTLTYYFDAGQNLQRINLHALTGDPSQLAGLMTQFYGLQPEHSLGGQLFTSKWNNRVSSVLHVAPAPIIYAGADHSKYIVFLELNQTGSNFALSEEAGAFLQNVQATQRW